MLSIEQNAQFAPAVILTAALKPPSRIHTAARAQREDPRKREKGGGREGGFTEIDDIIRQSYSELGPLCHLPYIVPSNLHSKL